MALSGKASGTDDGAALSQSDMASQVAFVQTSVPFDAFWSRLTASNGRAAHIKVSICLADRVGICLVALINMRVLVFNFQVGSQRQRRDTRQRLSS